MCQGQIQDFNGDWSNILVLWIKMAKAKKCKMGVCMWGTGGGLLSLPPWTHHKV